MMDDEYLDMVCVMVENTSTGGYEEFYIPGFKFNDETKMDFLKRTSEEIADILSIPRIVIDSIDNLPDSPDPSTIEEIKEFAEARNEDAEWDLPKGLLYADWFDICEAIGIEIDWEDIQFDKLQVFVKDEPSHLIDDAIKNLHDAGWGLPVHRHIILNGYDEYYEKEATE